ncbi:MAG: AbrB family transcriptional regulator [Pseudomonadota bacterium]
MSTAEAGSRTKPTPRWVTLLLVLAGVAVFWIAGIPLPFLFGPMAACLIAAFAGANLQGFGKVSVAARTILGVAVGSAVTPALISDLPQLGLSLALIPAYIAVIGCVGFLFFHRFCGYDPATAYFAAMPGGLQDMVIFGQEAGGDPRALSLIHATRVLLIVTTVPVLMTVLFDADLTNPIGAPIQDVPIHELLAMLFAAIVGWRIATKVRLFGASILGPMILAAILSLSDVIHMRPPKEAILTAQFFIGTGIGIHYMGITWGEFRRIILTAVAFVAILAILAAIMAELLPLITGIGPLEAFLAFAPGGQAEMTVMAIVAGADLGVVIAHHLLRLVLVISFAPVFTSLAKVKRPKR